MTFSNKNISTAHVKDEETRNALVRIEKQFKQLYDMIVATQTTVATLPVSSATGGAWTKLKTWEASGSETEITFEDSDGGFNSSFSQYMIIGEGLRPSTDSAYLACVMSVDGNYQQWANSTPVWYYSYFGYNEDGNSFAPFGSDNQRTMAMTDSSMTLGGDSALAETVDFTAYLTAPQTTGRPTKLRWWLTCESDSSMDFHGEMQNVVGWGKFSTSVTGPSYGFDPIDGIKFVFLLPTENTVMTIPWGKVTFYGLS